MRDLDALQRLAAGPGPPIGGYAAALLDNPLPWTKRRQVYAPLGLVKKWGPDRVEGACARAAEAEAFNVALIARMLERGTENAPAPTAPTVRPRSAAVPARFARPIEDFATTPSIDRIERAGQASRDEVSA